MHNNIYDTNQDNYPAKISIGITLITKETYSIIQDDREVNLPVDDEIVFLTVIKDIMYLPNGGVSYELIADLLEQKGYLKKHYSIQSIWECISLENEPF